MILLTWKLYHIIIFYWAGRVVLFLICLIAKVPKSHKDVPSGLNSHRQQLGKMAEMVHLPVHNIRLKWYKERPQLKVHDRVWIIDHREKRGFLPALKSQKESFW